MKYQKKLNLDFSDDVLSIIKAFEINSVKLAGTMNNKQILYANDYDCFDIGTLTTVKIKNVIRKLIKVHNTYIGDIKFGIDDNSNPIRWKVNDVLKGFKIVNAKKYKLNDCLNDKAMKKIDVIHLVNNSIYKEFSCVYMLKNETTQNDANISIKKDIIEYAKEKNYFKMLKRAYSIISQNNDTLCKTLVDFFNSSAGQVNNIMADIQTLIYIMENIKSFPVARVQNELDNFKNRFSTIIIPSFLRKQQFLLHELNFLKEGLHAHDLEILYNNLNSILQNYTRKFIENKSISAKIAKVIDKI